MAYTNTTTDTKLTAFAGQAYLKDGIRTGQPAVNLEGTYNLSTLSSISGSNGLAAKIGKVFIHPTRVFNNPLERIFTKHDLPYGVGVEQAIFKTGAADKKSDSRCIPRGNVEVAPQYDYCNYAHSIDIQIGKYEVQNGVLSPEEEGAYFAEKLRTPLKTAGLARYTAMKTLLTDVFTGTRSISSHTSSDGTGSSATYSITAVTPYVKASALKDSGYVVSEALPHTKVAFASASEAKAVAEDLIDMASDMVGTDCDEYVALNGVQSFCTEKPLLIGETKTLNAMDAALASISSPHVNGWATKPAREYLGQFMEIVEIDSWPALPTNTSYAKTRMGFALIDRQMPQEWVLQDDMVESECKKERFTGYNYERRSILSLFRGCPAAAYIFDYES